MSPVRERIETLSNRAVAVLLVTEVERLDALDDLWTRYLADIVFFKQKTAYEITR